MKSTSRHCVVLVTAPSLAIARALTQAALRARLVACGNLVPRLESHYWWQGKIESSAEALIVFKTTANRLKALERLVLEEHPYDTPEFIVLRLTAGSRRYLDWLSESVKPE